MTGRAIHNYRWVRGEKKLGGEWEVGPGEQQMFSKGRTGSHLAGFVP